MIWVGGKRQKEASTKDGYRLVVKYIDESKYTWMVFYNEKRISLFNGKPIFKKTIPQAKRQAIRVMIHHMYNKIDDFK